MRERICRILLRRKISENKRERDERAAEREIEKAKIASEEAKLAQQREIELVKLRQEKRN